MVELVDRRGHCLLHGKDIDERIVPRPGTNPRRWTSDVFQAAVQEEGSTSYRDPVEQRTYLVSYAPLPAIGWGALVQHERHAALKPIDDLKGRMIAVGGLTFATMAALVGAMWSFLLWTLRHERCPTGERAPVFL